MIKITFGSNTSRSSVIVSPDITIGDFLTENGMDTSRSYTLDGARVNDMNITFAQAGVGDTCYLLSVSKADNA